MMPVQAGIQPQSHFKPLEPGLRRGDAFKPKSGWMNRSLHSSPIRNTYCLPSIRDWGYSQVFRQFLTV